MPKLSIADVKSLLANEKSDALAAMQSDMLSNDRVTAMNYYNGDISNDMPAPEGRSSAVSSDVSDTIEGMMPSLMEIFCSGDEVVRFDPVGKEDVKAAEQETDYINHVFMQKNPGFIVMYSFIKDALLSKNGIVKVWWEEEEREREETYENLTDEQFMMLAADPSIAISEHTAHGADEVGAEGENSRAY